MTMAIIVTGAHGFVGLNVVRTLAVDGVDVIAIGRSEPDEWVTGFLEGVQSRVTHRMADLSQPGSLGDATRGLDVQAVVHAAVVTSTTPQVERDDALRIVSVNVGGTMEALDTAREHGAPRFVYVSSPSAIGTTEPGVPMDEQIPKRPDSLYGITKDASEELVRRYSVIHGLSSASVRIAQPYGPGERATASRLRTSPIYEWLLAAQAGEPLVSGPLSRSRDWTYIGDTARGIAMLATAPSLEHDLYHLARSAKVTVGEVITEIRKQYPDAELIEDAGHPDLNPNIAGAAEREPLDTSRFRNDFNWVPETGIEDGMREYLSWWQGFM
jgi:UDP-glucose 4-epimerase